MAKIGRQLRELEVVEAPIIPEREAQPEPERQQESVPVREREKEKVGV